MNDRIMKEEIEKVKKNIEDLFPGSKILEVKAQYSDWVFTLLNENSANEDRFYCRTMYRVGRNVIQVIVIKELLLDKDLYYILEYTVDQNVTFEDYDIWQRVIPELREVPVLYFDRAELLNDYHEKIKEMKN